MHIKSNHILLYGGFLKWVYPKIIHLYRIFPNKKPSITWGIPISGKPHTIPEIDQPFPRRVPSLRSQPCGL